MGIFVLAVRHDGEKNLLCRIVCPTLTEREHSHYSRENGSIVLVDALTIINTHILVILEGQRWIKC